MKKKEELEEGKRIFNNTIEKITEYYMLSAKKGKIDGLDYETKLFGFFLDGNKKEMKKISKKIDKKIKNLKKEK